MLFFSSALRLFRLLHPLLHHTSLACCPDSHTIGTTFSTYYSSVRRSYCSVSYTLYCTIYFFDCCPDSTSMFGSHSSSAQADTNVPSPASISELGFRLPTQIPSDSHPLGTHSGYASATHFNFCSAWYHIASATHFNFCSAWYHIWHHI